LSQFWESLTILQQVLGSGQPERYFLEEERRTQGLIKSIESLDWPKSASNTMQLLIALDKTFLNPLTPVILLLLSHHGGFLSMM
jgi:hypothetical protein